jgi:heme/copper-type cytochrome/quinol oxidase subunit 4
MVPTLLGRVQTRIFLLATVGAFVTAVITPILPVDAPLSTKYRTTFLVLAAVCVVGIVWEFVYHFLMQFRWEKDWPSMFGLLTIVNEGVLIWLLMHVDLISGIDTAPPTSAFLIQFVLVWVAVWLVANGPMRVPFIRWRFRGGRLA